jgi:hypothetical protein
MSKRSEKQQIRQRLEALPTSELNQHVITLGVQVAALQREFYVAEQVLKGRFRDQRRLTEADAGSTDPNYGDRASAGRHPEAVRCCNDDEQYAASGQPSAAIA